MGFVCVSLSVLSLDHKDSNYCLVYLYQKKLHFNISTNNTANQSLKNSMHDRTQTELNTYEES